MNQEITLQYLNEDDRAYGLAGMAITLAALDALDNVANISLDAEGPMVTFTPAYYHPLSQNLSPKASWDNLLRNLHITSQMVVGNVMARSIIRMHTPVPAAVMQTIHDSILAEADDVCSLESDEAEALYSQILSYSRRIFGNPRVQPAVAQFAAVIARRRSLSAPEISEELRMLNII